MAKRRGRGEGSIEQLPSGNWRAVVVLGSDPETGRRVRLTKTCRTKSLALDWMRSRQMEKAEGRVSAGGRVSLAEWMTRWLEAKKLQVEPATLKWYTAQFDRLIEPRLGGVLVCDLRAEHFLTFYAGMSRDKIPPGEQKKAGKTARAALAEAVRLGLIATNAATKVKLPRVRQREARAFTLAEARTILAKATGWFAVYVRLALDTGMRPGEILGLHWSEVHTAGEPFVRVKWSLDDSADTLALKPPKTEKGKRNILIAPSTAAALTRHRAAQTGSNPKGLVFPNADGGFFGQANVSYRHWKPLLRTAKVPHLGLYALRHTSATLLLAESDPPVNLKVVSERLGHEDVITTLKAYSHVLPTMQAVAAASAERLFNPPHDRPTGKK